MLRMLSFAKTKNKFQKNSAYVLLAWLPLHLIDLACCTLFEFYLLLVFTSAVCNFLISYTNYFSLKYFILPNRFIRFISY